MIDIYQYIFQIGLPQLERVGENWHFRCVICGDSDTNPNKKRGWIYNDKKIYVCYNCGARLSFTKFLKEYYNHVYLDYLKNTFKKTPTFEEQSKDLISKPEKKIIFPIKNVSSILSLGKDHHCSKYIKDRRIPLKQRKLLYYTDNFQKDVNEIFPDKFENPPEKDRRLLIPFFDKQQNISYVQGRTLDDNYLRYITIEFLEDKPKIFGLDRVDSSNIIYVLEGPIDSLFLDNAIAMGSASIDYSYLLSIANKSNYVFIMDNESRNREISNIIEKIINKGFKVCIFPNNMRQYGKDINDLIFHFTKKELNDIIEKNTFAGLKAKIQFKLWKKRR